MKDKIKLDIVSDVVCPWCIIGYKRLEKAISEMGMEDKIELEWQPFELNPNMPAEGQDVQEHITQKYGSTPEQSKGSQDQLTELGAELDFKFDYFDGMRIVNTRDAHILLDYAKESGKQTELNLRLIKAFFSERKDISNRQVLMKEFESIGLNENQAMIKLNDENARKEIQTKEAFWTRLGVSAVPTVVFSRKNAITGAQSVDVYKKALTDLMEK